MPNQTRNTLKNLFKNGKVPSQNDFEDLIDSNLNMIDEGFDKTAPDGLKITQLGSDNSNKLITFYKTDEGSEPLYFVQIDGEKALTIGERSNQADQIILSMSRSSETGVNVTIGVDAASNYKQPDIGGIRLDVGGAVRTEGRIGVVDTNANGKERIALADGDWYSITGNLTGCQAFEVIAGVGGLKGDGKYALIHAVVLNAYNPRGWFFNFLNLKNKIRSRSAYYRSRRDQLKLRWHGPHEDDGSYCLQIKTNGDYRDDNDKTEIKIKYYCTRLWFDADMAQPQHTESQG